MMMKSYLF